MHPEFDGGSSWLDPRLRDFSQRLGTPCYLYSLARLRSRIGELRRAFDLPMLSLLFATMANDRPEILRAIAREGVGACVNSMRHLDLALESGFAPHQVQFTSTGLCLRDMERLIALGIAVNLDSPLQAERWCQLAHGGAIGLRVNSASLLGADGGDRIGMEVADLRTVAAAAQARGVGVAGLHVYVGTNFQSAAEMLPTLRAFFAVAASFPELAYVNIGGGIGVDYSHRGSCFDIGHFGSEVTRLTGELCQACQRPIRVLFEPGRGLIAGAGVLLTRVTDVKRLHGRTYVAVDASIAVFPRPFHHPESLHRVWKLGGGNASGNGAAKSHGTAAGLGPIVVVGRTTFSRDILGRCDVTEEIGVDDVLVFDDAGAYSQSMMSRFLGQNEPELVAVEE